MGWGKKSGWSFHNEARQRTREEAVGKVMRKLVVVPSLLATGEVGQGSISAWLCL